MLKSKHPQLPPGPRGRWLPTLRLIRNPRQAFQEWAKKYGDPFLVNALNGPVVITGRADLIKQIFSGDSEDFGLFATKTVKPVLGDGSILMMEGESHRRERKVIMPLFHGDRMRAYGDVIQSVAHRWANRFLGQSNFKALELTTSISLEVIVRAIFGANDQETIQEMFSASRNMVLKTSPLIFFSRFMQFRFGGVSPWDRYLAARKRLELVLEKEIKRLELSGGRVDILAQLQSAKYEDGSRISPEHINHELSTLLFAGHETSAIAMAWAFYNLLRHPEILVQLKSNLEQCEDSPEALSKNSLLKAVVQESLRLNPIVTEVLRLLKKPMQLDRYKIPAGYAVAPATVLAHYDESVFPDADCFRPERFLETSYSSSQYFPFGGGHRRCVGAAFATYEMTIVLGTLIKNYEFELLEKKEVTAVRRNLTMGPSSGISMRLQNRAK